MSAWLLGARQRAGQVRAAAVELRREVMLSEDPADVVAALPAIAEALGLLRSVLDGINEHVEPGDPRVAQLGEGIAMWAGLHRMPR